MKENSASAKEGLVLLGETFSSFSYQLNVEINHICPSVSCCSSHKLISSIRGDHDMLQNYGKLIGENMDKEIKVYV